MWYSKAFVCFTLSYEAAAAPPLQFQVPGLASDLFRSLDHHALYPIFHDQKDSTSGVSPVECTDDSYWLEKISHQEFAAFTPDTSYQVFCNVKDFGAKWYVSRFLTSPRVKLANAEIISEMVRQMIQKPFNGPSVVAISVLRKSMNSPPSLQWWCIYPLACT